MKKFEFTTKNGDGYYRTVPAFMSDGVRVFGFGWIPFRYAREEFVAFNEKIFATEEEAETAIAKTLNMWMKGNLISSYTVTNT